MATRHHLHQPLPLLLVVATCLTLLAGCAHQPINAPLHGGKGDPRFYFRETPQLNNSEDTLFVVAFSGGGTRAAAFAYGVLEELRDTHITRDGKPRRLLDEVDAISAVSGGSVTAAAFGVYGDEMFGRLDEAFLRRNVQQQLLLRTLNPFRWGKLWSSHYGRSEIAAEYYDEILFRGATFNNFMREDGPFIILNATDITTGARFEFTQHYFDLLCSDVRTFPVSRAVAASSAVPGLLTPVTLNNYAGTCGNEPPAWMKSDMKQYPGRLILRAQQLHSYRDRTNHQFVHLVDGGVSDNVGLRAISDTLMIIQSDPTAAQLRQIAKVKRLVVISANAYSSPEKDWGRKEAPPGSLHAAAAAASHTLDHYSFETVELIKDQFAQLRKSIGLQNGVKLYPIMLNFTEFKDPEQRRFFLNLPTSFFLSKTDVDRLRVAGRDLLRQSPEFRDLVQELGGKVNHR